VTEPPFASSEILRPYVPRLVIDWMRESPELLHRRLDATLVFVDISGFTKLTERLSRKGKVGAEEMNDILDACFTELLSVAYDYGAGVIKWGGDAVLLLFKDEDHPARACRAAAEMQRTMGSVGKLRTSSGLVTLSMSIGVSSAAFDFFLVGGLHRELIVAGPAATETVSLEAAAEAREIVIGAETAAALDPACVGHPRGSGFLLRRPPDAHAKRSAPVEDVSDVDLRQCVPLDICEHLLGGGGEAEHRPMTPAFIQFMGVDDLWAREGPDAVCGALDRCLALVQQIARDHRIAIFDTDIAPDGIKVMLMAGAPRATGNDAERMVKAMRAVVDARAPLALRIGIAWGRIFAADFGPPYRRTYSVKGDAVNLAARLMARAEPSQVLATAEVLERSRTGFVTRALEPFKAKGKAEPVIAFEVGNTVGMQVRVAETPFVGRTHELAVLMDAFEQARDSRGRVVELVAGAGMGKSRLIEEISARVDWDRIVMGHGEEYERATPYFGLRDLLRDVLFIEDDGEAVLRETVARAAPHLAPWLPLVGTPLGLTLEDTAETAALDERFRKERVEEIVDELLGILLPSTTLLVVEDVHWLDEASADLLRRLVRAAAARPWVVLIARREEPGDFRVPDDIDHAVLDLQPLGAEEAEALVHGATDEEPLQPHVVEALAQRAGGNPLFLAELLTAARRSGGLEELPDSVEAVLMAEIDRLAPLDRRVLRSAAVVGAFFTPSLVSASMDDFVDADVWERLAHYVTTGDGIEFRFRHALARDVAYEGLPFRRRLELHERIGDEIERQAAHPLDEAELLSLHFFHAQRFEKAWSYSRAAGERAQAIYANVEAKTLLQRALDSARRCPALPATEVGKAWDDLGDVQARLGEFDRAAVSYRSSRRFADGSPAEQAQLMLKEAKIRWLVGRYDGAYRWLSRGLRLLAPKTDTESVAQRARLHAWCAAVRLRQGKADHAITACRLAIDEANASGAKDALAHACYLLDWAYDAVGRSDEAVYSQTALEISEELGDFNQLGGVLNNLGVRAHAQGRWDEALGFYERAREAWKRAGTVWAASFAEGNVAEILSDQGRLEEAEPLFRDALRVARASGSASRIADVSSYLGRLLGRAGRFEEAQELLTEAWNQYERDGNQSELLASDARIAECLVAEGRAEPALELAERALARARTSESVYALVPMLERTRGWALILLGRLDEADEALTASLEEAEAKGAEYERALTLDALAALHSQQGLRWTRAVKDRDAIFHRLGIANPPVIRGVEPFSARP
jgi:class 3 adenylate cyclase/tetratricopeptide (TPR) repeat protein